MLDMSTLTNEELKLCYKQKQKGQFNAVPLKFILTHFDGQLKMIWLEQYLLKEIARRYCAE